MYKWFKWRISDLRSVSARVNARGYPWAKGCNSSASQWLFGEQVRLCSGDSKVHFGTIVEGSWGGGGGGGGVRGVLGGSSGLPRYSSFKAYNEFQDVLNMSLNKFRAKNPRSQVLSKCVCLCFTPSSVLFVFTDWCHSVRVAALHS